MKNTQKRYIQYVWLLLVCCMAFGGSTVAKQRDKKSWWGNVKKSTTVIFGNVGRKAQKVNSSLREKLPSRETTVGYGVQGSKVAIAGGKITLFCTAHVSEWSFWLLKGMFVGSGWCLEKAQNGSFELTRTSLKWTSDDSTNKKLFKALGVLFFGSVGVGSCGGNLLTWAGAEVSEKLMVLSQNARELNCLK